MMVKVRVKVTSWVRVRLRLRVRVGARVRISAALDRAKAVHGQRPCPLFDIPVRAKAVHGSVCLSLRLGHIARTVLSAG